MIPYTLTCTNIDCVHSWQTFTGNGFGLAQLEKFKCPRCDSSVTCTKYIVSEIMESPKSATIVKGVGTSDFKSMPSDWKNFMSSLHKNTKDSNMKDRF